MQIEIKLINKPKIIINLSGNFECFTKPSMATSTNDKKLFLVLPCFLLGWSNLINSISPSISDIKPLNKHKYHTRLRRQGSCLHLGYF